MRFGLWHEAISRDGPGVLLRDLDRAQDDLLALAAQVRHADPDVLVLTKFDFDAGGMALSRFAEHIGPEMYPYRMPLRSNEGVPTGVDLDGNGYTRDPQDGQGYGLFPGQGGLALLSRYPILEEKARDFSNLLWKDIPNTHMRASDPGGDVQYLSSGGHWFVPIELPVAEGSFTTVSLLLGHAIPPVFDGPEDRNGRRNLDELHLWSQILDGAHGATPGPNTVFMTTTNLDPQRGDGYRHAMRGFLADGTFQDPLPYSATAIWETPGPMRVTYLLPSAHLHVKNTRLWPRPPGTTHHLITVDISLDSLAQP